MNVGEVAAAAGVSVRTLHHCACEALAPGLAQYGHDAVQANAAGR